MAEYLKAADVGQVDFQNKRAVGLGVKMFNCLFTGGHNLAVNAAVFEKSGICQRNGLNILHNQNVVNCSLVYKRTLFGMLAKPTRQQ